MAIPVLVVDDEPNFLELVKEVLGKRGFAVNVALNGTEALKLLDKELFDFALLDIKLGLQNGFNLLEEIKKRQPRVKAIMVTAFPTVETRMRAHEKGASAYLAKPVDLHDLLQTFQSVLSH
ncbi:MAG TPA: response regulator [Candidatus Binatia bacterium]|jgi:DNA-binding response OmpR family regulator